MTHGGRNGYIFTEIFQKLAKIFAYLVTNRQVLRHISVTTYDDTYYVSRVRGGDTDAFAHLVRKYQRMVFTTAAKITGSQHDAEDISQEVFIKVFGSLGKFNGGSEFSTWLYRIAYNTTVSEVRRRRRDFIRIDETLPETEIEDGANAPDAIANHTRTDILESVLKTLAPEDAQLIMMRYYAKFTVAEVSAISGLSVPNVKVRLHRIRNYISMEISKLSKDGRV